MDIRPIHTDHDHRAALAAIEFFGAQPRARRTATGSMCFLH